MNILFYFLSVFVLFHDYYNNYNFLFVYIRIPAMRCSRIKGWIFFLIFFTLSNWISTTIFSLSFNCVFFSAGLFPNTAPFIAFPKSYLIKICWLFAWKNFILKMVWEIFQISISRDHLEQWTAKKWHASNWIGYTVAILWFSKFWFHSDKNNNNE